MKRVRLPLLRGNARQSGERPRRGLLTESALHPDAAQALFEEALTETAAQMRRLVRKRAAFAAGAALVPIPGLDFCTDVAGLSELLDEINRAFHLTPEDLDALALAERRRALEAIRLAGAVFAGQTPTAAFVIAILKRFAVHWFGAKATKWIPVIGQGAAAASSGALFVMLGDAHIRACLEVRRRIRATALLPAS